MVCLGYEGYEDRNRKGGQEGWWRGLAFSIAQPGRVILEWRLEGVGGSLPSTWIHRWTSKQLSRPWNVPMCSENSCYSPDGRESGGEEVRGQGRGLQSRRNLWSYWADSDFCSQWVRGTPSLQRSDLIWLRFLNDLHWNCCAENWGMEIWNRNGQESTAAT